MAGQGSKAKHPFPGPGLTLFHKCLSPSDSEFLALRHCLISYYVPGPGIFCVPEMFSVMELQMNFDLPILHPFYSVLLLLYYFFGPE